MENTNEPLWLPPGSIRAIIALMFSVAVIVAVMMNIDSTNLKVLTTIAVLVIGQYFGTRANFGK